MECELETNRARHACDEREQVSFARQNTQNRAITVANADYEGLLLAAENALYSIWNKSSVFEDFATHSIFEAQYSYVFLDIDI